MPIKPVFDLHTHTMASGHAYSTLLENLTEAKHKGLLAMGTSDHSPGMIHTTHKAFLKTTKYCRAHSKVCASCVAWRPISSTMREP